MEGRAQTSAQFVIPVRLGNKDKPHQNITGFSSFALRGIIVAYPVVKRDDRGLLLFPPSLFSQKRNRHVSALGQAGTNMRHLIFKFTWLANHVRNKFHSAVRLSCLKCWPQTNRSMHWCHRTVCCNLQAVASQCYMAILPHAFIGFKGNSLGDTYKLHCGT